MLKWTVIYKQDGQTWTIQREVPSKHMYDPMSKEEYNKLPEYIYYLETNKGLIKCTKDKKAID